MRLSENFKKIRKNSENFFSNFSFKRPFFKDRSFFYATFLKFVFTEAPAQFLQETKRFARGLVKGCDLPETIKNVFEKF